MPARIMSSIMDGELHAGPIVQTIFVLERLFIMEISFHKGTGKQIPGNLAAVTSGSRMCSWLKRLSPGFDAYNRWKGCIRKKFIEK